MIADIVDPFVGKTLCRKIDYQLKKIEMGNGVARELYNNSGDSLIDMYRNMTLVASLNDRVKSPYIEFTLNSPIGEDLPDEKFLEVTKEYLERMGYGDSCYTVIKNNDKDHRHVHVLATTIDLNGLWISDGYSKERSGKIMRELEFKYGLEAMEKGKSSRNKSLGESQYRQYFFDTALHKALRSHNVNERVKYLLEQSETYKTLNPDMYKAYTNSEWKIILGDDSYEKMLEVLSNNKLFNPLLKEELLFVMDRLYQDCGNVKDFRSRIENEGYYMRLISDKGKSHYVYGVPDRGFYIKDTALPDRYRFGKLLFAGKEMTEDEQKHYLYNKIFVVLNNSSGYEDFKDQLAENSIKLIEHVNEKGIYGLSFAMENVETPKLFRSSDISRRLTYKNILDYYLKGQNQRKDEESKQEPGEKPNQNKNKGKEPNQEQIYGEESKQKAQRNVMAIDPIISCYVNNREVWERDLNYMYPPTIISLTGIPLTKEKEEEDDDTRNKKKKKKNKGLSL